MQVYKTYIYLYLILYIKKKTGGNELLGMKLIAPNNQSTTFQNITEFHSTLSKVDFVIDDTPPANFKKDLAYTDWLSAAGYKPNNKVAFISSKNVFRTDLLINAAGHSGKYINVIHTCKKF